MELHMEDAGNPFYVSTNEPLPDPRSRHKVRKGRAKVMPEGIGHVEPGRRPVRKEYWRGDSALPRASGLLIIPAESAVPLAARAIGQLQ